MHSHSSGCYRTALVQKNQLHPAPHLCLTWPLPDDHLLPVQWRFREKHGCAMGSPESPTVANLWEQSLDHLHTNCLPLLLVECLCRLVIDTLYLCLCVYLWGCQRKLITKTARLEAPGPCGYKRYRYWRYKSPASNKPGALSHHS